MKQLISLFVAAFALVLTGCSVEPFSQEEGNIITIKATMAENNTTKTVIQEGTTSVLWEPEDEVKVFYKTTGSRFTSGITEPAGTADFTGNLTITGFFSEGFTADTPLWAVYPYRADAVSDGESVTTTLPSSQAGRAGSFAKGTNITLAKSTNMTMGFYNVCGGIRFTLTKEGIKEVVFQGQNDEDIAGKVKLAFVDGVPAVQEIIDGQKTITLTAPNGGTFETGKWYYIVALPGTLSNGFKMTFNTATQYASFTSSVSRTIKRGIFGSLSNADEGLVFKDKEGGDTPNPDDVIQFADIVAKYACVEKFDTNHDGEVSYKEAAAASSLSGLFSDWNMVTSFDEIQYFTGVTSISGVFTGLKKLTHITVPEWITTLGNNTFMNCSALETVILPNGITSIPQYCFRNCGALTTLTIPSSVTLIDAFAFSGCTQLAGINLPSNLKTIGNYAFHYCQAISSLDFPGSLTSIGQDAFSECSSLSSVSLPENLSSIPAYCFLNCTALTAISWPQALISIGDRAFAGCRFKDADYAIELPSTVTSIGDDAFGALHHIVIPSAYPVSIASDSFVTNYTFLYVPSAMVEMYKVLTNWSNYEKQIRPISDYPVELSLGGATGEAIDLGLSVKWASWNVGASAPEDYGAYFSWGETDIKWDYDWASYKWCMGSDNTQTKYCTSLSYGYKGLTDGKTVLDPEDDAAHVVLGGKWRMPTDAEWTELRNNCTWTWTTLNGVKGRKVTSNKAGYTDKWIFLPAAGYRDGTRLSNAGSYGHYWSSSLYTDNPSRAWNVYFSSGGDGSVWSYGNRCSGQSVRPVTE